MTAHGRCDDPSRDLVSLYVLGLLPEGEAGQFESHRNACASCRAEAEALGRAAADLSGLAPEAEPPADLRSRLFEQVRSGAGPDRQPWKKWTEPARNREFVFVPGSGADWVETSFTGVQTRRLFADAENDRITMLVRMEAGASYPGHVHGGAEECYVLEGDLQVGDLRMRAGDYQRAGAGSRHPVQSTRDGCLLLIVSSTHDELDVA